MLATVERVLVAPDQAALDELVHDGGDGRQGDPEPACHLADAQAAGAVGVPIAEERTNIILSCDIVRSASTQSRAWAARARVASAARAR